ncbi:tyrosine-type recombinase/integrase [Palleronia sp. LCG004]|uniref:tyrosine-type recombinase/integrase n=1 Tax=Palleronia sp. LCG004 TaxID=3079304 RepID=UPI0029420853|nr:tyrosine-type recombinase/integrase [Palleronia sp. LCG004]WOI57144.1 tyrosine-type recombinase/integrase [Palleronia sp. LCG004]
MDDLEWTAATLSLRNGIYYAYLTIPLAARTRGGPRQMRLTTGTSDFKLAQKRLHDLEAQLRVKIAAKYTSHQMTRPQSAYMRLIHQLDLASTEYAARCSLESEVYTVTYMEPPQTKGELASALNGIDDRLHEFVTLDRDGDPEFMVSWWDRVGPDEFNAAELRILQSEATADLNAALGLSEDGPPTILDHLEIFRTDLQEQVQNGHLREKTARSRVVTIEDFAEVVGNQPMVDFKAAHAYKYARSLSTEKANKTIKARLSHVSTLFDHAVQSDVIESNPFRRIDLRTYGKKLEHYAPLTDDMISQLFAIPNLPEDVRNIWAILAATGMRLDEVATLRAGQVKIVDEILHFDLQASKVKNRQSQRRVPVCEAIRPLVEQMVSRRDSHDRLFDFPDKIDGKTRASERCNYWMKKAQFACDGTHSNERYTTHSLRGSFKDKMRDAGVSREIHSAILGHDLSAVSAAYGRGPSLKVMKDAVDRAEHPYIGLIELNKL